VARVRERTIPTERPPQLLRIEGCLVVSAEDPLYRILCSLDRSHYVFFQIAPQLYSPRLSGPRSRPTTSQKIWMRRESNADLWICSQER
jgi:hypothetical protein